MSQEVVLHGIGSVLWIAGIGPWIRYVVRRLTQGGRVGWGWAFAVAALMTGVSWLEIGMLWTFGLCWLAALLLQTEKGPLGVGKGALVTLAVWGVGAVVLGMLLLVVAVAG